MPLKPGDSAEASSLSYGLRSDGSVLLPGNKYFRNQGKLVKFLRDNPGYVYKNRGFLKQLGAGRFFKLAGYNASDDLNRMQQFEGVPGSGTGKLIRAWTDDPDEAAQLKKGRPDTEVLTTKPSSNPKAGSKPTSPDVSGAPVKGEGPTVSGGKSGPTPPAKKKPKPVNTGTDSGASTLSLGGSDAAKALAALVKQARKIANQRLTPTLTPKILDEYLQDNDPLKRAETAANLAYDAQISALQNRINSLGDGAISGVFSDLDKFWGMLGTENANAKAADQAQLEANSKALNDAAQGFMGAIGGSAEPGAASIGQQAVISDAGLKAMGTANTNFDTNLGNFFAQAGAGQKAQIAGDIERQRAELASQMTSLEREKGMYQSQEFDNLSNENAETKLSLMDALFNQRQQIQDDAWDRVLGLGNLVGQASLVPQQIEQGNVATAQGIEDWKRSIILNAQERERLKQFQAQQNGGEQFPFSQLEPGSRATLAAQLQQNLFGPMGYLAVNPDQFLSTLRNRMYNTAGYSQTPQTEKFIMSLLTPRLINWWNKYHPKQAYTG